MIVILFSRLSNNITNQPSCDPDSSSSSDKLKQNMTQNRNSAVAAFISPGLDSVLAVQRRNCYRIGDSAAFYNRSPNRTDSNSNNKF